VGQRAGEGAGAQVQDRQPDLGSACERGSVPVKVLEPRYRTASPGWERGERAGEGAGVQVQGPSAPMERGERACEVAGAQVQDRQPRWERGERAGERCWSTGSGPSAPMGAWGACL